MVGVEVREQYDVEILRRNAETFELFDGGAAFLDAWTEKARQIRREDAVCRLAVKNPVGAYITADAGIDKYPSCGMLYKIARDRERNSPAFGAENAAQSAAETQPAFGDRGRDGDGAAVKNVNFDWGTGFHGAPPKLFTTW